MEKGGELKILVGGELRWSTCAALRYTSEVRSEFKLPKRGLTGEAQERRGIKKIAWKCEFRVEKGR